MMQVDDIRDVIERYINDKNYYIVDLSISSSNNIVVEIDHFDGVSLDFCVELTREIESKFDREVEDYELEVSSAGLTSPFKTIKQYEKNIGNEVEVITKDGKKIEGILTQFDDDKITIEKEVMIKPEGAKRKVKMKESENIFFENIKTTKYIIRFK